MNKIAKTWESLREQTRAWLNPQEEEIKILPPLKEVPKQQPKQSTGHPHQQRTLQVFEVLDRASQEGLTAYTDLIDYVRQKTGKGCSKKLVSKWKKERGLVAGVSKQKELEHKGALASQIEADCEQTKELPSIAVGEQEVVEHKVQTASTVETDCEQTETKPSQASLPVPEKPLVSLLDKILTTVAVVGIGMFVIDVIEYLNSSTQTESTPIPLLSVPAVPQTHTPIVPISSEMPTSTLNTAKAPQAHNPNLPRQLKFNLSLSSPKDLKVKEGDMVTAGEVLARRVDEESRLIAERQAVMFEYQKLQAKKIPTPIAPVPVPTVKNLPAISYAEEEVTIAAAVLNVQQAERALKLQQEKVKTEPLEESAAVQRAAVEVKNRQYTVDKQLRKIEAVKLLKNLPPAVAVHEQEVLKKRYSELQQAEAEYQQAQAKLSAAKLTQTEKLQQIGASLEKAKAERQLAIAKLQTKKDQRAYTEYEASIAAAQRASEQNQAAQNYSRQLLEAEQQKRDRWFELAQIKAKIDEIDQKMSKAAVVTSPYTGVLRRLKIVRQNDNTLSAELILDVDAPGNNTGSGNQLRANSSPPVRF